MMKNLICILCFLCLNWGYAYSNSTYGKLEKEILHQVSKKVVKRHPMYLSGIGGGIRHVAMGYTYNKEVNVEQAREIYVDIAEEFIRAYNADKRIRPYMIDYPFEPKNLSLDITFVNKDGVWHRNGSVAFIIPDCNGNLSYHRCVSAKGFDTEEVHFESYKDALKIVKAQSSQKI